MSIQYALLVGQVTGGDRENDDPRSPHYTIYVSDNERSYRVPVNVQSGDGSEVLYYHDSDFDATLTNQLELLGDGMLEVQSEENGVALDYIRGGYLSRTNMQALPASQAGENNDLQDIIDKMIQTAKQQRQQGAKIYIFGEKFPGGMHDVHMNQGNSGRWSNDNGVWQDGALIFYFPFEDKYHALFFAFQNQSWHTDHLSGHPVSEANFVAAENIAEPLVGYQQNFLGDDFKMPLPTFNQKLKNDLLTKANLQNEYLINHPHYSVAMSKKNRQAIFSAANANFSNQGVARGKGRSFRLDPLLENNEQLSALYYKNNYDKGHLSKRHAVAWGQTKTEANHASKKSCYFSNIALQDHSFHHAEWGRIENAITSTRHDLGDRFNIITGPVFTTADKIVHPTSGNDNSTQAPSGFWKVISYIGSATKELEVNAFISFQNEQGAQTVRALVEGRTIQAFKVYQTSTTLIERMTGLIFIDAYKDNNPLLFFNAQLAAGTNVDELNRPQLETISDGQGFVFSQ